MMTVHYPVRFIEPDIVCLEWSGIYPRIDKTIKLLRDRFKIEPELNIEAKRVRELECGEIDDRILDLLGRGEVITAATLVRQKYGYDMTKSKQFVDEFTQHPKML